jgi:hypothetical protein
MPFARAPDYRKQNHHSIEGIGRIERCGMLCVQSASECTGTLHRPMIIFHHHSLTCYMLPVACLTLVSLVAEERGLQNDSYILVSVSKPPHPMH